MRAFRDGTPYGSEDLFFADSARPQRPLHPRGRYPRNVPEQRRIDGADLTFRFPRSWLAQWRDVADAMDRLTVQLHGPGN